MTASACERITRINLKERLTSSSGKFTLKLADLLEEAAAAECGGGEFDLTQGEYAKPTVKHGRLVATLEGVTRCK